MECLYVLLRNTDHEWEDTVIFTTEKEAIDASIKYSNIRVEIFKKTRVSGYTPTYNYYQNGELYITISR
jgi:hypothetical protein